MEHGFVDKIVKREELKETLAMILKLHKKPESGCLADWKTENTVDRAAFEEKEQNSSAKRAHHGSGKAAGAIRSAWDSVLLSRKADRPVATDYIRAIFDDSWNFTETVTAKMMVPSSANRFLPRNACDSDRAGKG